MTAVLEKGCDLVMPFFALGKFDGLLNSSIYPPLTRALSGRRVRFPLAPDFCLSSKLIPELELALQRAVAQGQSTFWPATEAAIKTHGKVRILFIMHDFHGWDAGAMWEDIKFDLKHFAHIERLAIVGETKWEKGMSMFCRPFTTAKIKYFDHADIAKARDWIEGK